MLRFLCILLVAVLLPIQAGAETTAASPERAYRVAPPMGGDVQVFWLAPIGSVPDLYRVYGYSGGSSFLLKETNALSATVAGGYTNYAVTAVYGANESAPETADGCYSIATVPPEVDLSCL